MCWREHAFSKKYYLTVVGYQSSHRFAQRLAFFVFDEVGIGHYDLPLGHLTLTVESFHACQDDAKYCLLTGIDVELGQYSVSQLTP
ncbi:hypothetical protein [Mycobacterium lepromatosis]|uniref:hypothetical protein n=1 Tax=Mycobacterium lepromatosis TaxID=480418 RepID=UPI0006784321|nr:hypothetical protein [Mycobacterium lepromatosis]